MFDAFFSAILVQAFGDGFDGSGVDEVMGADGDGTGTGQHEFDGILPGRYAAQAEDGDGYGLSRLPYHAQGDGLDSRAGQAAGDIAQQGAAGLDVDGHARQGIDERYGIGTGRFDGFSHDRNVRDIRRQFDDDRFPGMVLDAARHSRSRFRLSPEDDAPFFDVRTGNIDFQGSHAVDIELSCQFAVFFGSPGRYIDDERRLAGLMDLGQDIPLEDFDAGIFQADAVEHPCRRFGHADAGIARPRQRRDALGNNGPDVIEVEKITVFYAKSKGPRCSHDRCLHGNTGKLDGNAFADHAKTSFASNTGPSAQTL